jgi:hypothetical protein
MAGTSSINVADAQDLILDLEQAFATVGMVEELELELAQLLVFVSMKHYFLALPFILSTSLLSCTEKHHKAFIMTPQLLTELNAFKAKDKFSANAWEERGLMPSPEETVRSMSHAVNAAVDEIINSKQDLTEEKIQAVVEANLDDAGELDTEEREFLAETFYELSSIMKVDTKDILNSYMYGFHL